MKRINDPTHARFLTFSTYKSYQLFSTPALRDVFKAQLLKSTTKRDCLLYAWVLMPNHVHMLVRDRDNGGIESLLRSLKPIVARTILARWRELDAPILKRLTDSNGHLRFWQHGGGYDRNITSKTEFDEKVGYIHMNPVRGSLVESPGDWAWGSARWWSGIRDGEVECHTYADELSE